MDAFDFIEQIADGEPSDDAIEWLAAGFRRYLVGTERIDQALGFSELHPHGPRCKIWRRQVNKHLREAGECLGGSCWTRAVCLAETIKRLDRRPGREPRNDLERSIKAAVDLAASAGLSVPRSNSQLYRVLHQDGVLMKQTAS